MVESKERSLFLPIAIVLILAIAGVLWFGSRSQGPGKPAEPAPAATTPAPATETAPVKPAEPSKPAPPTEDFPA